MENRFIEITDFCIKPYNIEPTGGYERPKNKETGAEFPNCCPFHKNTLAQLTKWFDAEFPECCSQHRELKNKSWFKKSNYKGLPEKVINQLSYSEHHIQTRIHREDWYKDITDYLEYNHLSFGTPAIGYGYYEKALLMQLKSNEWLKLNNIPKDRAKGVIDYLEDIAKPKKAMPTNLNLLYNTYQKWLKTFPFEISYFRNAKPHFISIFPVIEGTPVHNPYTGMAKITPVSPIRLIEILTEYTKQLLGAVNAAELVKEGHITDVQKHSIDLLNESHRIRQSGLIDNFSKGEMAYVKILKNWLRNEKDYFKEFARIHNTHQSPATASHTKETRDEELIAQFTEYGFFTLPLTQYLTEQQKHTLIRLIVSNKLPYQIAMLDYIGFIAYLEERHFPAKYKLYKQLAKWLKSDKDGRNVRGNILSLSAVSTEDKRKFTAHLNKEQVKTDYQKLKLG